jgi:hypothetical protein
MDKVVNSCNSTCINVGEEPNIEDCLKYSDFVTNFEYNLRGIKNIALILCNKNLAVVVTGCI